ncbi:hypothetical protein CMUS01_10241 [Colletotrichum musicola]|uniref:Uncharacterized protein n=1 Tax=Colletotrichum musicola TaxID=2175873 RepID=A0A8H6K4B4_9PEZI|nr:hypothetical protein CMUS01_10241 [Colletotrichum musicola]
MDHEDLRSVVVQRFLDHFQNPPSGSEHPYDDEKRKLDIVSALVDLFSQEQSPDRGKKLQIIDAALRSFQDPKLASVHLDETLRFHSAAQVAIYPPRSAFTSKPVSVYSWAAFLVPPVEELELLLGNLDGPRNRLSLAYDVNSRWCRSQVSFEPLRTVENGIRLRLHYLPGAVKLGEGEVSTPPFVWCNDLAQNPMEVFNSLPANDDEDGVRLVSAETQHLIREGHDFDVAADLEDPEDIPDMAL